MSARVLVCGGVGGVGKTTTAAALALGLALKGERVVVLTIDPARRLADALGLATLGNTPSAVPLRALGHEGPGSLDALMLDRKATFDEVVTRFAPSEEVAARLLENRYYRAVSTRLTGSHEYMASEKLYDLVASERWDVVVVDTPPAQHALEFFRAPDRVRRVFDRTVLGALVQPGRGLLSAAGRRLSQLLESLAGEHVLSDITEFFGLLGGLSSGFRERSRAVHELLHSGRTRYFVVTSASAPDRADVLSFLDALRERDMGFEGFLVNRVARVPALRPEEVRLPAPPPGVSEGEWDTLRRALVDLLVRRIRSAQRQQDAMRALATAAGGADLWTVPDLPRGVRTLEGLLEVSRHLPPAAAPLPRT